MSHLYNDTYVHKSREENRINLHFFCYNGVTVAIADLVILNKYKESSF